MKTMGFQPIYLKGSTVTTSSTSIRLEEPEIKKQYLKCVECGKKMAEFYGPDIAPYHFDIYCKTCHQIEKLKE